MGEMVVDPLGPDELVFVLETNQTIDAHRFADFLGLLINADVDRGFPHYEADILELGTGSLFGKLRLRFSDPLPAEKANETPVLQNRHARRSAVAKQRKPSFAERQAIAAERQADAAERSLSVSKGTMVVAGLTLAATVAGILMSIEADAKNNADNDCAALIAEIMDADGVTSVNIRSRECNVSILRQDVPAYLRLQEGLRPKPRRAGEIVANLTDGAMDGGTMHRERARGIEAARAAADTPSDTVVAGGFDSNAPWVGGYGDCTGVIRKSDSYWTMDVDSGILKGRRILIVPRSGGDERLEKGGDRVSARGTVLMHDTAHPIMVDALFDRPNEEG